MNLGKLANLLWRTGSKLNTLNIILSGNPNRISKHLMRRFMVRRSGNMWRGLIK